jgi:hypothetical protein
VLVVAMDTSFNCKRTNLYSLSAQNVQVFFQIALAVTLKALNVIAVRLVISKLSMEMESSVRCAAITLKIVKFVSQLRYVRLVKMVSKPKMGVKSAKVNYSVD